MLLAAERKGNTLMFDRNALQRQAKEKGDLASFQIPFTTLHHLLLGWFVRVEVEYLAPFVVATVRTKAVR